MNHKLVFKFTMMIHRDSAGGITRICLFCNLFSRSLALSSSIYIFGCVCAYIYIYIKFLNTLLFSDGNMISNFRKNGFTLEEDPHAPPGQHFKLKAVPFSKNITFGVEGSCCFQIFFP